MGPTNAMDPRLQQEINNFPPEAKVGFTSVLFTAYKALSYFRK